MKIKEIAFFTPSRKVKTVTVKKKKEKEDDSLSKKVQDRLLQIRKQQGTVK